MECKTRRPARAHIRQGGWLLGAPDVRGARSPSESCLWAKPGDLGAGLVSIGNGAVALNAVPRTRTSVNRRSRIDLQATGASLM
jgi:hypothetical protein